MRLRSASHKNNCSSDKELIISIPKLDHTYFSDNANRSCRGKNKTAGSNKETDSTSVNSRRRIENTSGALSEGINLVTHTHQHNVNPDTHDAVPLQVRQRRQPKKVVNRTPSTLGVQPTRVVDGAQTSVHESPLRETTPSTTAPPPPVQIPNEDLHVRESDAVVARDENVVPVTVQPPRRRHAAIPKKVTWRIGRIVTAAVLELQCAMVYHCGSFDERCAHCGAKFFQGESRNRQGIRLGCCKNGSYAAPPLGECPPSLKNLYTGNDHKSVEFRNQIRLINSLFAMASLKTSRPVTENKGQGPWRLSVCGQIYHFTGGVPDAENLDRPRLQHYYFLDTDKALKHRRAFVRGRVHADTLETIEITLRSVNRYVKGYNVMGEVLSRRLRSGRDVDNVIIGLVNNNSNINILCRDHNLPHSPSDTAALFDGIEPPFRVDLRLYSRSDQRHNGHHELKNLNSLTDPMVYPLLFPRGDDGYSVNLAYRNHPTKTVTLREFYRYRIQVRDGFSVLHCGGKLFQQYLVDAWIKVEANMLWWQKQHQIKLRRMEQQALRRYNRINARGDTPIQHVDRVCVLPASFYGSDRHRQRQYLDAMTVVARHGKPDLFITFTCNPRWVEISSNLEHNQKWEHRPDLVCRVFHVKLLEFMDDIIHKQLYGVVLNYHYVIEFQERGLPHAHIIVTFIDDDKLEDSESVDSIISAVIPDRIEQPLLYQRVGEYQIHTPCGPTNPQAPCMRNNRCSKSYPLDYAEATRLGAGANNRPIYKRPRDGRTILVPNTRLEVTNQHVVPYNSFALAKYACHINFEVVGSLLSIKYLFKYVSKGAKPITRRHDTDDTHSRSIQIDEIKKYLDCRRVCSMEATWRLMEFKMSDRSHAVLVLPVHLPGENNFLYDELNDDTEHVERRLRVPSKLEAWFALNQSSPEARRYKYVEIPEYYTWDGKMGRWIIRKQIPKMIGCIAKVGRSADQSEKHCLRTLLAHVRGATSFEDLRTVEGQVFDTFKEACERRNYLYHLNEYELCLTEVVIRRRSKKLRELFGLICCAAVEVDTIPVLWQRYSYFMIEDFVRGGMAVRPSLLAAAEHVESIVSRNNRVTLATLGISIADVVENIERLYDGDTGNGGGNNRSTDDDDVDRYRTLNLVTYDPVFFNLEQKKIFLRVLRAISLRIGIAVPDALLRSLGDVDAPTDNVAIDQRESVFYVGGPAGSGKTYLYNTLLTVVRQIFRKSTTAVAWTDVGANLLIDGQTVRRAFRLPPTLNDRSVAGWPLQDENSKCFKDVALIIWDEAQMAPKLAINAVDRYLRRIHNTPKTPMGGQIVIFGGDFRQMLPDGVGVDRSDVIENTLKFSPLWPETTKFQLTGNMRAGLVHLSDPLLAYDSFANWLLRLGEGRLPYVALQAELAAPSDLIEIPAIIRVASREDLITFVYGDDFTSIDVGFKAILCSTNPAADKVNSEILSRLPGEDKIYVSVDEYKNHPRDDFHVTDDILNSINSPSLPPHELHLKVGAVVILLRDVYVDGKQCNGTRLRVTALYDHVIECQLLTGDRAGAILWLPKIKMTAMDTPLPSEVIRMQFPVKLAFAMPIDMSQGQSMVKVGVYLNRPCSAHGQLYVAFSRVSRVDQLRVFVENGNRQGTFKFRERKVFTRNVVFPEVLSLDETGIPPRDVRADHESFDAAAYVEVVLEETSDNDNNSDHNNNETR